MCLDEEMKEPTTCNVYSPNKPKIVLIVDESGAHLSDYKIIMHVLGNREMVQQLRDQFELEVITAENIIIQRKVTARLVKTAEEVSDMLKAAAYSKPVVDTPTQRQERNENRYRSKHFKKI